MNVQIRSISPDGLEVKFLDGFIFDTYDDVFKFILKVEDAEREIGIEASERTKKALEKMKQKE